MKEHHDSAVKALTGAKPKPEQINLASHPKYAAKLKEMESVLLEEMRRHDDPYRFWNQPGDDLPVPLFRERNKSKKPKKNSKCVLGIEPVLRVVLISLIYRSGYRNPIK
jgi:hypothetical protein